MLKLQTILDLTKCTIVSGDKFLWECYGPFAHIIEFHNVDSPENEGITLACIINRQTQQVLDMELVNNDNMKTIKWIDKYYREEYQAEKLKKQKQYEVNDSENIKVIKSKGKMLKLIELHF